MVAEFQQLCEIFLRVGRGEHVHFFPEVLPSQLCLLEPAGCGSGKIVPNQRVGGEHRERLLCQQDFAAGSLLDLFQQRGVLLQQPCIREIARRMQIINGNVK